MFLRLPNRQLGELGMREGLELCLFDQKEMGPGVFKTIFRVWRAFEGQSEVAKLSRASVFCFWYDYGHLLFLRTSILWPPLLFGPCRDFAEDARNNIISKKRTQASGD